MADTIDDRHTAPEVKRSVDPEQYVRIEAKHERASREVFVMLIIGIALLGAIWAITEWLNDGSPNSFTVSSGRSGVWNLWIIYPLAVGLALGALHLWINHLGKPFTKHELEAAREQIQENSSL